MANTISEERGLVAPWERQNRIDWVGIKNWLKKNPAGALGMVILIFFTLVAIGADLIATHNPESLIGDRNEPLSEEHILGTDPLGRDTFSRLVHGARVSLFVGISSVILGVSAGTIIGLVSGYIGGKLDLIIQRFVDALIAIPGLLLALVLVAALGPSVTNVVIALGVGSMPSAARITRSVVLREKGKVYSEAARAIGASRRRVMFRHVLPNSLSPSLVLFSVSIGAAIISEASLSFLGVGVGPEVSSWGSMLAIAAARYFDATMALAIAPGLAISITVFGFNLFGDAVRDSLNPKLRSR